MFGALEALVKVNKSLLWLAVGMANPLAWAQVQAQAQVQADTPMETVKVTALPWRASAMESAQPVTVLSGEQLRNRQAATLGATLEHELGVHSTDYGPGSGSPIIRGLEGPRVLVSQNGLDAGDASRVGPDHAVATEAATARQIEILRGPATLLYGSGAIGGVVNIVDERVPRATDTFGEWRIEHNSVANDRLVSASGNSGIGALGVHADGFWRAADDYQIPGPATLEHEQESAVEQAGHSHDDRLANSAARAKGINLGASFVQEAGFVGLAYGRLERQYGLPGHTHGDEEADIYADLSQDRVQLISELSFNDGFFNAAHSRFGFTNYEHSEIEKGEASTRFRNKTREVRLELFHRPIADWRGALSFHVKDSAFSALGAEAFTPPSRTNTLAVALMEERHIDEWLIQLGIRTEKTTVRADNVVLDLGHDENGADMLSVLDIDHEARPVSASAGAVWNFTQGYNLALSYTYAQRAPSAAELLSFGPHLGSGLYEVGALLHLIGDDPDAVHVALSGKNLALETSNNLDLSLRKFAGNTEFVLNTFYNAIDNYYYLADTGLSAAAEHNHSEHNHSEHNHDQEAHDHELPIYVYEARNAELYGVEAEFIWNPRAPLRVSFTSDYIRAHLKEGGNLPRIPPLRMGLRLEYQYQHWLGEISSQHYFKQEKTATLESATDGYTLLDFQLSYALNDQLSLFVKGNNLTDEYARSHTSFLKEVAPLPARAFSVGLNGNF